jgi:haloalkane dehalogenase
MSYVDAGSGTPVVLVHGTPSSSKEWRHVTADLARDHRVLAPDHLGFGDSSRPADWRVYSFGWHTANLRAWLDQLGLPRFHLVVHDVGGPVALPIALEGPDRLLSLTIVQSWLWDLGAGAMLDNPVMRWLYLSAGFSARAMVRLSWGRRKPLTRELHREFIDQFPDRAARAGTWGFARSVVREGAMLEEHERRLSRLATVPKLLVWGKADRVVTADNLDRWRRHFPDAQVLALDDVGHFPQIEAHDELVGALRRRLASDAP